MKRAAPSLSTKLRVFLLSARLAFSATMLVTMPPVAAEETCPIFKVQMGPSVFAFHHEGGKRDTPFIIFDHNSVNTGGRLQDVAPCSGEPQAVKSIEFLRSNNPLPTLVEQGEFPPHVRLNLYPFVSIPLRSRTEEKVRTHCRDGFDQGFEYPPERHQIYGCLKDSGRALIWICNQLNEVPGRCRTSYYIGRFFIFYAWDEKSVRPSKVINLDGAVRDYLDSLIVSGERLPE